MTRIANSKMRKKDIFGDLIAETFNVGDIVEWSTWNREISDWESHYGVVIDIKNEIKSGRLVSISTVKPIEDNAIREANNNNYNNAIIAYNTYATELDKDYEEKYTPLLAQYKANVDTLIGQYNTANAEYTELADG